MPLAPYTIPNSKWLKNGKFKLKAASGIKWFDTPMRTIFIHREGEYQNIKYEAFNPGSRHHIRQWMREDFDYNFPYFTPKGNPKVDVDSLENMEHLSGKLLKRYLKVTKDQSQVGGGDGSLINNYNEERKTVKSRTDTNGTITGRFTSSAINLAQIPASEDFRSLFRAPKGWSFIGTDFSGQENVNLAEMLYPYDNGRLDKIISSGDKSKGTDLHSLNAKACGISRGDAKPLWFGFLYGSSPTLTGYTLLGDKEFKDYTPLEFKKMETKLSRRVVTLQGEAFYPIKKDALVPFNAHLVEQALFGAKVQADLIASTEGLKELIKDLSKQGKQDGFVTMFGGRRVPIRHAHATLNSQLQGMGAEAMKHYLVFYHEDMVKRGLDHRHFLQEVCIYDEVDIIGRDDKLLEIADVLQTTYVKVSDHLGMKCTYTGEVLIGGKSLHRVDGKQVPVDNSWHGCH